MLYQRSKSKISLVEGQLGLGHVVDPTSNGLAVWQILNDEGVQVAVYCRSACPDLLDGKPSGAIMMAGGQWLIFGQKETITMAAPQLSVRSSKARDLAHRLARRENRSIAEVVERALEAYETREAGASLLLVSIRV